MNMRGGPCFFHKKEAARKRGFVIETVALRANPVWKMLPSAFFLCFAIYFL